jgi:hypothetical protein
MAILAVVLEANRTSSKHKNYELRILQLLLAIDEIYLGTFAAVGILGAVLGITLFVIGEFSNDGHVASAEVTHLHGRVSAVDADSQANPTGKDLNPEQLLAARYEQSAYEEISRCLDNGDDSLPPLCDDTMWLLIESCKDPISRVSACDDPRLLAYSNTA